MFKPKAIYYEKDIENYILGKELLEKYNDVPKIEIENHNAIEEMRKKENKEFMNMKQNLIIGTRKTHKYTENHKVSDFLVPYTSSGCTAACMYCYLVCNYNKCAYLRLFVNREQMIDKIIKTAEKSEKEFLSKYRHIAGEYLEDWEFIELFKKNNYDEELISKELNKIILGDEFKWKEIKNGKPVTTRSTDQVRKKQRYYKNEKSYKVLL